MQNEFSCIARQNRVRKYLPNISLSSIMAKKSCNVGEALEELREAEKRSPVKDLELVGRRKIMRNIFTMLQWEQNGLKCAYSML